jgi:hypothetical protein
MKSLKVPVLETQPLAEFSAQPLAEFSAQPEWVATIVPKPRRYRPKCHVSMGGKIVAIMPDGSVGSTNRGQPQISPVKTKFTEELKTLRTTTAQMLRVFTVFKQKCSNWRSVEAFDAVYNRLIELTNTFIAETKFYMPEHMTPEMLDHRVTLLLAMQSMFNKIKRPLRLALIAFLEQKSARKAAAKRKRQTKDESMIAALKSFQETAAAEKEAEVQAEAQAEAQADEAADDFDDAEVLAAAKEQAEGIKVAFEFLQKQKASAKDAADALLQLSAP